MVRRTLAFVCVLAFLWACCVICRTVRHVALLPHSSAALKGNIVHFQKGREG